MMKRTKILNVLICVLFLIPTMVFAENEIYTKTFDTESVSFGKTNYNALYKMDNLAFKDSLLTVSFTHENEVDDDNCEDDYCLIIKQYDRTGKKINELYIQDVLNIISPVVIDDELYILAYFCDNISYYGTCNSEAETYLLKYDNNLEMISSIKVDLTSNNRYDGSGSHKIYEDAYIMFLSAYGEGLSYSPAPDDFYIRYYDFFRRTNYEYFDFYQIHEENNKLTNINQVLF